MNQRRILDVMSTLKALGMGAELMATQKFPSEALDTPSGKPGRLSRNSSRDPVYIQSEVAWKYLCRCCGKAAADYSADCWQQTTVLHLTAYGSTTTVQSPVCSVVRIL